MTTLTSQTPSGVAGAWRFCSSPSGIESGNRFRPNDCALAVQDDFDKATRIQLLSSIGLSRVIRKRPPWLSYANDLLESRWRVVREMKP